MTYSCVWEAWAYSDRVKMLVNFFSGEVIIDKIKPQAM